MKKLFIILFLSLFISTAFSQTLETGITYHYGDFLFSVKDIDKNRFCFVVFPSVKLDDNTYYLYVNKFLKIFFFPNKSYKLRKGKKEDEIEKYGERFDYVDINDNYKLVIMQGFNEKRERNGCVITLHKNKINFL